MERAEVLGDSAYGTGELLDKINKAGWDATIKPHPLRPPVEGGFTLDDFSYDAAAGTLTCPNQITRRLSKTRSVTFGAACRGCPLRERCTTAARGRTVNLSEFEQVRRDHRERRSDPSSSRCIGRNGHWSNAASPGSPAEPAPALPRRDQEQRLAPPSARRAEPTSPPRPGLTSTNEHGWWPDHDPDGPQRLHSEPSTAEDDHQTAERPRCRTHQADSKLAALPPLRRSARPTRKPAAQTPLFSL